MSNQLSIECVGSKVTPWLLVLSVGLSSAGIAGCGGLVSGRSQDGQASNAGAASFADSAAAGSADGSPAEGAGGSVDAEGQAQDEERTDTDGRAGASQGETEQPAGVACADGVERGGGVVRCPDGVTHRPVKVACVAPEAPSDEEIEARIEWLENSGRFDVAAGEVPQVRCRQHEDCSGGAFCQLANPESSVRATECVGGCEVDEDCGAQGVCSCRDGLLGSCIDATCQTDGDCAGDLLCAVYRVPSCGDQRAFACQQAEDLCTSDAECGRGVCSAPSPGAPRRCMNRTCDF